MKNGRGATVIPTQPINGAYPVLVGEIVTSDLKDGFGATYEVFYEHGSEYPILHYTEVILVESENDVPNGRKWNRSDKHGVYYFK